MEDDSNRPAFNEEHIDPETPWYQTPFFGRLIALVLPPLGLLLLWRNRNQRRGRKILGAIVIGLYLIPYTVLVIYLLVTSGFMAIEWKGGFGPSLVWEKTQPNYRALEQSRAQSPTGSATSLSASPTVTPYWTDFRGPNRDGRYDEQPISTNWASRGPRLLWTQLVGGGYASLVVAEGRAFTIEQRRGDEAVAAYDLDTGVELWAHQYPAQFEEWMGGEGPRATPTYHEGLLYSLGATGEFCCLGAANGRALWQKNILSANNSANLHYGLAASPLIVDDKVIVLTGEATAGNSVVAYHRLSGDRLWSAQDDKQAYTSPLLATLAGQRQLLVVSAHRVMGLTPEAGKLLWDYPWKVQYDNAITVPVIVSSNRFLISAGYGTGCALVEVSQTNGTFATREVFRNRNLKTKFNAAVLHQGHVYGLDEGVLACLDLQTGERKWRDGRYGYGQLLLASGHLIILGGEGELALVRASPDRLEEVGRFRALTGKTWNVPALAHGRLLVRNSVSMACYDVRAAKPASAPR